MQQTAIPVFILTLSVTVGLAMHATLAAATMYCGLGLSGQSCAEFPIVTHYSGQFDLAGNHADPNRVTPSYQRYSGTITDTYAPSSQEVLDFINAVEQATGCPTAPGCVPVMLYNYDSDTALSKLVPGLNKLQVLHNVWVPVPLPRLTTLFTVLFPPGWQPTQLYPLLLSGNGSTTPNNAMFFLTEQTRAIAGSVAGSTQAGHTGLMAVLSNTGGREALGAHQNALNDLPRMLTFMQSYGVDRFRVVHFGASRGGETALLWAENPDQNDYISIGVFALSPPSHIGFTTQQPIASYQGTQVAVTGFFSDATAYQYGHVPRLIDVNPSPWLSSVLDQADPWKADRPQQPDYFGDTWRKSPSGYAHLLRSRSSGGNLAPPGAVVLSAGTLDGHIPLPMVLKLDRDLTQRWAVPHLTCVTLRTGHSGDVDDCPRAELSRFLEAVLTGQPYTVPDTDRYFKAADLTFHRVGSAVALSSQMTQPFTITVPYRLRANQWATLAACGGQNHTYSATLTKKGSSKVLFKTGVKTFGINTTTDFAFFDGVGEPDPGCDVIRLDRPGGWGLLAAGTYLWSFTYDGQAIDSGKVGYIAPSGITRPTVATTIIDTTQPSLQDAVFEPNGSIGMGVDQY